MMGKKRIKEEDCTHIEKKEKCFRMTEIHEHDTVFYLTTHFSTVLWQWPEAFRPLNSHHQWQ
jgi:hypothetical protein